MEFISKNLLDVKGESVLKIFADHKIFAKMLYSYIIVNIIYNKNIFSFFGII
jgi:hypothetical protein